MKRFTQLIADIDATTSTNEKVQLLAAYFSSDIDERHKLWTIGLFTGRRPPRAVNTSLLREWCAEIADIPLWLLEENYHIVGDLAETISLIVPISERRDERSLPEWIQAIQYIRTADIDAKKAFILDAWMSLDRDALWVFNKVITGGFRIGISRNLIIKSLSRVLDLSESQIAHKLIGKWTPDTTTWQALFVDTDRVDLSQPFPFYLCHALPEEQQSSLDPESWVAEWKWDGIRSQLILRSGTVYLWSRGEELITDKFPEVEILQSSSRSVVLDGELVVTHGDKVLGFKELQTRIHRKSPSPKIIKDLPAAIIVYDILEIDGDDIRSKAYRDRRQILTEVLTEMSHPMLRLSPILTWTDVDELRRLRLDAPRIGAEGLMLKHLDGPYHSGRKTGEMYKWKVDPYTVDAVLLYAQRGHGRRANLYSDFTFAVRDGDRLVPFAKAYSGLTDLEMKEITAWVKSHTIETFGPVASVKAALVFELAFEAIALSTRHKAGVAVRFPRIVRWRTDKAPDDADTLDDLKAMIRH
jgi:DNA ligase 1